jgi:hypothetical protein
VYSQIWAPFHSRAPSQKKIFRKAKNFSGKCWRQGVDVIFSKTKVPEIFRKTNLPQFSAKKSSFLKHFAIPACQGPLPASCHPYFTLICFFWGGGGGCYTPAPLPPPKTCKVKDLKHYTPSDADKIKYFAFRTSTAELTVCILFLQAMAPSTKDQKR